MRLWPWGLLLAALPLSAQTPVSLADAGQFRIRLAGRDVGVEEFRIARQGAGWRASGQLRLQLPGQPEQQATAELELGADGTPLRYRWQQQRPEPKSLRVEFHGAVAHLVLQPPHGPTATEEFHLPSPHVVILDNNFYHHFALLARLYDWKAGGTQAFAVLIPQDLTPGTVRVVAGTSAGPLTLLRVLSSDLEVDLYLDAAHRLMRLTVPGTEAEIVREPAH